jgi:hypothetical protein
VSDVETLALYLMQGGSGGVVQGVLDRTEHQRQRRAEFVTDVGEEQRLRPVDFRQSVGAPALFLESARTGKTGRNLAGQQFDETGVAFVVFTVGIEPADNAAEGLFLSFGADRNNDCLGG